MGTSWVVAVDGAADVVRITMLNTVDPGFGYCNSESDLEVHRSLSVHFDWCDTPTGGVANDCYCVDVFKQAVQMCRVRL